MIVPTDRLLIWVAALGVPAGMLAGAEPAAFGIALAVLGGLTAIVVADALAASSNLNGLVVEVPPVTRVSKDRPVNLEVRVRNQRRRPVAVRLALSLPQAIRSDQEDLHVVLPADSEWSGCSWPCIGAQRGRYPILSAHLEVASPLGFWDRRATLPLQSEIRVYPNLFTERRNLAALFLHRGGFGVHAQRQLGKGREFEKLREYIPGDCFDEIHWKATARRGRPITKVFQVERTQEVYVIIDSSRLSARSAATTARSVTSSHPLPLNDDSTTLERFVTSALILGLAAEQQGDLFGLLTFGSGVETFVRARNGKAHYNACRDALYTLKPRLVTPDFDELCTFIRQRLRRRSLLVFLTALDDPVLAENFMRSIDLLCRQHLVLVNMLRPRGISPLFTGAMPASFDELYQRLGGQLLWNDLQEIQKVLSHRGARFTLIKNERLSADLVSQYLAVKQRQML